MRIYVDADVLIWHLRARPEARDFLDQLLVSDDELWIPAVQRAEVLFHARRQERLGAEWLLSLFQTEAVGVDLAHAAAQVFWQWNPSHGVGRDDAILAACAMRSGGRIYTLNARHFPMPGLDVVRPW